jgi:DNA excision repair protein ERCC-4
MTSSTKISSVLTKFLSTMDSDATNGMKGRKMMLDKLKLYLWWKKKMAEEKKNEGKEQSIPSRLGRKDNNLDGISEALKKKDKEKADRTGNRRRVRGGAPTPATPVRGDKADKNDIVMGEIQQEADNLAELSVLFLLSFRCIEKFYPVGTPKLS